MRSAKKILTTHDEFIQSMTPEVCAELSETERWLFLPENKAILERVIRGLKQKGTVSWDSVRKKYE